MLDAPILTSYADTGSINASTILYKSENDVFPRYHTLLTRAAGLLETVLFANIRFHDTVSRGRLLNRFGKDFEGAIVSYILYFTNSFVPRNR